MRFISYLLETRSVPLVEKHDLVLQKVIDALDNSHVEYSDSKILFDVGDVSGTPKLKGLKIVIRPGSEDTVRLGRGRGGEYAIVVSTKGGLPGRQEIDSFLSGAEVYAGFQKAYTDYVTNFHDHDKEYDKSDTESQIQMNSRDEFEGCYNTLVAAVKDHCAKYHDSVKELDNEANRIANVGKKSAIELAKTRLKDDMIGADANAFVVKVLKFPEADFSKHLDKEWKERLSSRLSNYYTQNF